MHQHAAALDVPQELVPQAVACVSPFQQTCITQLLR